MTVAGRPRVVLDCNVLLQAVLSPDGPAARCVTLVADGRVLLLLSAEVIAEARDVLTRPFVVAMRPDVTPDRVMAILGKLTYRAEVVGTVPQVQTWSRDPKDAPYLNLVIAGEADFLVSRDADLLEITSAHSVEAKQFRQLTRNQVQVLDPRQFLDVIATTSGSQS